MKKRDVESLTSCLAVLLVLLIGMGLWPMQSYFEAQAYNHVTGKNVTTWDAMWIDLRVQAGPK